ncbi:MAG: exodeoxyribonuclease III [Bacteroidetes bacterium]|jgi:exodeoxyribonuclease-3|nr:exodeoxyribonuclease III [Bacteroidota bacterium]
MRIVSYNLNGIRAAIKKGLIEWLKEYPVDVFCVQETKAAETDIDLSLFTSLGYHVSWFSAQKKGYSGVAVFSKKKPTLVKTGSGFEMSDAEGRVIRVDLGDLTIINAYFPSGTSGAERQTYKYQWLEEFESYLNDLQKVRSKIIVAGDYNIAHQEIDIHDPKGNKKSSGFLPEERAWMDSFLKNGWVDSYRKLNPTTTGGYSWWSQRFPSVRLQNKGWRIDYLCTTEAVAKTLKTATILPLVKHSDHCPIVIEL